VQAETRGSPTGRSCARARGPARRRTPIPSRDSPGLARLPGRPTRSSRPRRERGWRLAILSNSDRDLIDVVDRLDRPSPSTCDRRLGDRLVQAPRTAMARRSPSRSVRLPDVHVAQSHFHDVVRRPRSGSRPCGSTASASGPSPPRRASSRA
jgi:hypothetical protein